MKYRHSARIAVRLEVMSAPTDGARIALLPVE